MKDMVVFNAYADDSRGFGHVARSASLSGHLRRRFRTGLITNRMDSRSDEFLRSFDKVWTVDPLNVKDTEIAWAESFQAGGSFYILDGPDIDCVIQKRLTNAGRPWALYGLKRKPISLPSLLIDPSPMAESDGHKRRAVGFARKLLLGPTYAVLPRAWSRSERLQLPSETTDILVNFGLGDVEAQSLLLYEATRQLETRGLRFHLVGQQGRSASRAQFLKGPNSVFQFHGKVSKARLANLYRKCGIAVIGGGGAVYEAAYFGVPSLVISNSDNQLSIGTGYAHNLGFVGKLTPQVLLNELRALLHDCSRRSQMAIAGRNKVDGLGGSRISLEISRLLRAA